MTDTDTGPDTGRDTDTVGELEHTIAGTLHAKADQIAVEHLPPIVDTRPPATVIHLTPPRPSRRRIVAMVAVAALLVTGIGLASRVGDRGTGVAAAGATTRYGAPASGMAGLLPAIVPSGWSLASLDVGAEVQVDTAQRWQLFGAGDGPPLDRGVLVGSARQNDRVIDGATHTVHGRPAQVGPPADPSDPAGALTAAWVDAGVVHDVVAVGLGEDELVAFLDGLTPRADPLDGFDAVDAAMPEIGATTVGGVRTTSATYVGPAGPTDQVRVSATSGDGYGGLLHRLDGVASPGGLVRRGALGGDPSFRFVGQARDDGWSVGVVAIGSVTVAEDAEVLDEFLASLRSATHDDLVALALAQPTTGSFPLGGGRTVEVHGTGVEDVGLCVVRDSAPPACGTAEALPDGSLVAASLVVDGRWTLVTLSDAEDAPTIRVGSGSIEPGEADDFPARAAPDRRTSVSVTALPVAAGAVEVVVPTGEGTAAGFTYEDPLG